MRSYITGSAALFAALAFAPDAEAGAAADAAEKATKSIVPKKYGNKYKGGGSDALAEFIKAQCTGKDGFEFPTFFELCKKNGLPTDKVDHYSAQVAEKRHGAEGRARMTLRNMLATIARKNGKLVGMNGDEVAIDLPKPALTGAAAKAAEAKDSDGGTDGEPQTAAE